jgi:hypothetical protein
MITFIAFSVKRSNMTSIHHLLLALVKLILTQPHSEAVFSETPISQN